MIRRHGSGCLRDVLLIGGCQFQVSNSSQRFAGQLATILGMTSAM
nr:hypothetical protein [Novosphingobium sp. Gsoil 351]